MQATVARVGWCLVVASEGVRGPDGRFLAEAGTVDAFGHAQLGGVAPHLAQVVKDQLGFKVHWTVPDYLQRSARHLASATDLKHALAVGRAAVQYALAGRNAVMPVIRRIRDVPYHWKIVPAPLADLANHEKKLPEDFIRDDGHGISAVARRYFAPLLRGQAPPPYRRDGIPAYVTLKNRPLAKTLPAWPG